MQLQKENDDFSVNGTVLSLTPKIRSDILEGLAEEIIKYTAYPRDDQFEKVAEALIQTHPCLHEKGTPTGYSGWKHYIKDQDDELPHQAWPSWTPRSHRQLP